MNSSFILQAIKVNTKPIPCTSKFNFCSQAESVLWHPAIISILFHNHFLLPSVHESSLCSAITNLSTAASQPIMHALPVVNFWIAPYFNLAGVSYTFTHFFYPQVRLGVHLSSTNHDYVVLKTHDSLISIIKSVRIHSSSRWVSCLATVYAKLVSQIICDETCYPDLQLRVLRIQLHIVLALVAK